MPNSGSRNLNERNPCAAMPACSAIIAGMNDATFPALAITPYWSSVQDDLLRIVDLFPQGKLNWTPKEELWNARGILIHVADARDITQYPFERPKPAAATVIV